MSKILLVPEDCASSGLSQDPSNKKKIIYYRNILLGVHFNLRYSKLKSDYLEVTKSGYVMGVGQNHFYHAVMVIILRKNLFFEKINLLCNSVHLDRQNDVKFNMFRCLIPLIWMILLWRTENLWMLSKHRNVLKNTLFSELKMAIPKKWY